MKLILLFFLILFTADTYAFTWTGVSDNGTRTFTTTDSTITKTDSTGLNLGIHANETFAAGGEYVDIDGATVATQHAICFVTQGNEGFTWQGASTCPNGIFFSATGVYRILNGLISGGLIETLNTAYDYRIEIDATNIFRIYRNDGGGFVEIYNNPIPVSGYPYEVMGWPYATNDTITFLSAGYSGSAGGPTFPTPPAATPQGTLQDSDFKTEAELVSAGATAASLLNDTKIYVTSIAKTLDDAIADGDIVPAIANKGDLLGNAGSGTTNCVLDKTDGYLLTVDSGASCGFDFKAAPVSVTVDTKGDIQTHDGTNPEKLPVGADGTFLVADSAETTGLKWSDSITGLISQAQFVGSLQYKEAGCNWTSSSGAWSYLNDTDCVASNIIGSVSAPALGVAGIKIDNARTDGFYKVKWNGLIWGNNSTCAYTLSEIIGDVGEQGIAYVDPNSYGTTSISGNFKFSSAGDKTIQMAVIRNSGVSNCELFGLGGTLAAKVEVHFFPDSNSLAAFQNTQLDMPVVTDWTPYTPAEQGFGGTGFDFEYRRIGDTLEVQGRFLAAAPTGFDAAIYLPSGLNIKETSGNMVVGVWAYSNDSTLNGRYILGRTGDAYVRFGLNQHGVRDALVARSGTSLSVSGRVISVNFKVPIAQWSATEPVSAVIAGTFSQIEEVDAVLDATTANELTAKIDWLTATVESVNFNKPNGNKWLEDADVTKLGVGTYTIDYSSLGLTVPPVVDCVLYAGADGSTMRKCHVTAPPTTTGVTIITNEDLNDVRNYYNQDFGITLSKQGADVNKSIKGAVVQASSLAVECEKKYLLADVTTNNTILSDLTFTLETGKKYRLDYQANIVGDNDNLDKRFILNPLHNGRWLAAVTCRGFDNFTTCQASSYAYFTAENTTLEFEARGKVGNISIDGLSPTRNTETHATLCKLPDNYVIPPASDV